jgi:hypothetical protein
MFHIGGFAFCVRLCDPVEFGSAAWHNRAVDKALVCLHVGIDTLHHHAKIAV